MIQRNYLFTKFEISRRIIMGRIFDDQSLHRMSFGVGFVGTSLLHSIDTVSDSLSVTWALLRGELMRTKYFIIALLLSLSCIFLSACSLLDPVAAPADPPLRVTPIDTSAEEMIAAIGIVEDQDATDKLSVVNLQMSIDAIEESNYAHFYHGEYVVCNGVKKAMDDAPSYSFKIDPGGYTCNYVGYKRGIGLLGSVTMTSVTGRSRLLPQPPSFNSQGFTMRYSPDSGSLACDIVAKATDNSGNSVTGNHSLSDIGVYNGPGTSSLTGSGAIVLTRTCTKPSGNPFSHVNLTYISMASVEVTWSH